MTKEMTTQEEIKSHLRNGDMVKVANMVGVTPNYAIQLWKRPTAKRHSDVLKAAKKVANANIKLGL